MDDNPKSVWDRVDVSVLIEGDQTVTLSVDPTERQKKVKRRKRLIRLLDVLSVLFWVYMITKLFIFDVDRALVSRFFPSLQFLLDYKFFITLGVVSIILVLGRKRTLIPILYVALFPLIVLFWKIPRALYRTRSWIATLGAINLAASALQGFKFNFIVYTLACFAVLAIVFSGIAPVLLVAIVVVATLTVLILVRTIRMSFRRSRFVELQRGFIRNVADSTFLGTLTDLEPALLAPEIEKYNKAQLDQFRAKLSSALVVITAIEYWAHQLGQYRKSGATAVLGIASYAWLFIQTIVGASIVNYGLLKLSPDSFSYPERPNFLQVVHYTVSALYANGVEGMEPSSTSALAIKIALAIIGPILLATAAVTILLSVKQGKQDDEISAMVEDVKAAGSAVKDRFSAQFEVSASVALDRLRDLGNDFVLNIIDYMAAQMSSQRQRGKDR